MQAKRPLVLSLSALVVAMFGFGYLLVPLYNVFCEITGLNGKTSNTAAQVVEQPDLDRIVTIEFTGTLNQSAPWKFRPVAASMEVHPGKAYVTNYFAQNLAGRAAIGHAVPSVAPGQAAKYLHKIECFCFTEQVFAAGEQKDMPVRFVVDPELPAHIDTLTLSYTFFEKLAVAAQ